MRKSIKTTDPPGKDEVASVSNVFQTVAVNRSNIKFKISGTAKADSIPLTSKYRSFGIALRINYVHSDNCESDVEYHYQEFNAANSGYQCISASIIPNENIEINTVDYAFVYGYNKNTMVDCIGDYFTIGECFNYEKKMRESTLL